MNRIGCVLFLLSGCIVGSDKKPIPPDKTASAVIQPTTGNTVTGTAEFSSHNGTVTMTVTVADAPEGDHGFHIHQDPACGNDGMDAGAHWNGETQGDSAGHGLPDSPMHHTGDTVNITIAADGSGTLTMKSTTWTVGDGNLTTDVVNHAVIFHMNADDGTMTSAGARLGCGIIVAN